MNILSTAINFKSDDNTLDLEHLRKEGAGEFIDRIEKIKSLKNQITALEDTIYVKRISLTRQLSEFPKGLKIPIPWMNHKEVPLDEAIPLFHARQRELYLDLRYLRDPCGEKYEEFTDLKSYIIRYTEPQFKAHKEEIQEQLKFRKEKKEIQDLSFKLRWLQREYLTFAQTHSDTIMPEVQERLFDAEELIILPDLKTQQEAAQKITKHLRKITLRINFALNDLRSIKNDFMKYDQIQRELITLNEELNEIENTSFLVPDHDGELVAMNFDRAYDEYVARTEAARSEDDSTRADLLMQIENDFSFIEDISSEIEELNKKIEEQKLLLDNQYLKVEEAREKLDKITIRDSQFKSVHKACQDLRRLDSVLFVNENLLNSFEKTDFQHYFDF